jgi:hypothetical protein
VSLFPTGTKFAGHVIVNCNGKRILTLRKKEVLAATDVAACLDLNRGRLSDIELEKREVRKKLWPATINCSSICNCAAPVRQDCRIAGNEGAHL